MNTYAAGLPYSSVQLNEMKQEKAKHLYGWLHRRREIYS